MRTDLVEKVLKDLKGIIPYKENIIWKDFKSIRLLGRYKIKENTIFINEYLDDDQTIMNTIAHELIHAAGVHNHGLQFKEYMNKINSLNLDFKVATNGKYEKLDKMHEIAKEKRANRKTSNKQYIVWCERCGYHYLSKRKSHKLRNYRCPKCYGKLRQKQYKEGATIEIKRYIY